jgi:hypothetical protein
MKSLDIFSIRALMHAVEQVDSTMDLEALPEKLFSAVGTLVPGTTLTLEQLDVLAKYLRRRVVTRPDFGLT